MGNQRSDLNDSHLSHHHGRVHTDQGSLLKRTGMPPQQTFKHITQTSHSKNPYSLSDDQLNQIFQCSGNDVDKYFHLLQQKISEMYMDLSVTTLENMNSKRFINNQSKVYITQNILSANLRILKVIGQHNGHNYSVQNFRKLNKIQKGLIGYLKSKYPRNEQSFVPGDLMNVFKQFSIVQHPKNDILKNAQIYFGDPDNKSIAKTAKIFINKIIEELDNKFPEFQKLLQQQVFVAKKQQGEKTAKAMNYKIGRKIAQNVGKYTDLKQGIFEIQDPEIFRVIIKWVSDMQMFLLNPQDEIQEKETFKTVQREQSNFLFDDINVVQIEAAKLEIQRKLQQQRQSYEKQIKELIKQMDYFNSNLLKILGQAELMQKFVPKKEAEVIKFAMFNTKMLSWMVAQKLMLVIKKLIKVGQSFEHSEHMILFDLIKFNVTDLMRAMVTGTKKEIFQVFQNMKRLELEGKISIIKVKNRLATPLNDAMIIFKMKGSFIICQLQLVLSEKNQGANQKLKNIQTLNHFFYQLERSPYGVQSQLAIVLGFKDSKIKYQDKITYQNSKIDFILCTKDHPNQIKTIENQMKPFICSSCTKFYGPARNLFVTKNCGKCNTYLCSDCLFRQNPSEQTNFLNAQIKSLIRNMVQGNNTGKQKISKEILNAASNVFIQNADLSNLIKIQSISGNKQGSIKTQAIAKWLYNNKDFNNYLPQFFYVQFKPMVKKIYFLKLNQQTNSLLGTFNISYDIVSQPEIKYKQYDSIVLLKKTDFQSRKMLQSLSQDSLFSPLKRDLKKDDYNTLDYYRSGKYAIILDGEQIQKNNSQLKDVADYQLSNKNYFKLQSIQAARKNMPNIRASREIYELADQGIDDTLLKYFQRVTWKNEIKQINVAKNKISSIQPIVQNITSLQLLYVSQNFISEINFSKAQPNLRVFNANNNKINTLKNWDNLLAVQRLEIEKNNLQSISSLKLNKLKIINISNNQIENIVMLQKWNVPELTQFKALDSVSYKCQKLESLTLNFPKLKLLFADRMKVKKLVLKCKRLQKINCNGSQIQKLQIQDSQKLQSIDLSYNSIEHLQFFRKNQSNDQLIQINAQGAALKEFPNLKGQNLRKINFSFNQISDISQLETSYLPNLQIIDLQGNPFSKMVVIPSKKIKEIYLTNTEIADISCFQDQEYPLLQIMQLDSISNLKSFCKLNAENLVQLGLSYTSIEKLTSDHFSNIKKLKKLTLYNPELIQISPLDLPELTQIDFSSLFIQNFDFLGKSNLPKISNLSISNCGFKQNLPEQKRSRTLPAMDFPSLKFLSLIGSSFKDIKALAHCKLPNLESLYINSNQFREMPAINFPKIKEIYANNCQISNLQQFSQSQLSFLQILDLTSNKLTQFPILSAPKLQTLYVGGNAQLNFGSSFSHSKLNNLKSLNLSDQNILNMPKLNLASLQSINITYCKINSLKKFSQSNLPNFNMLYMFSVSQLQEVSPFNFIALKSLLMLQCGLKDIIFLYKSKLPALSELNFQGNQIKNIPKASFPRIKTINFNSNLIQDISNLTYWGEQIEQINLFENKLKKLPRLKMSHLHTLNLRQNILEDITQLCYCQLPILNSLQLSNNELIKSFPQMKHLSVQTLTISSCGILSLRQLKNVVKISTIVAGDCLISEIPSFQNIQLKEIYITNCKIIDIRQFCQGSNLTLTTIDFSGNQIEKINKLDFPFLTHLSMNINNISDVDQLSSSNIPSIVRINLSQNKIKKIGSLPFKDLVQLELGFNQIQSVDQLFRTQYKNLSYVTLYNNKIKKIKTKILAPLMHSLELNNNLIQSLSDLSFIDGHMKGLQSIMLSDNKIKKLTKMNASNITNIFLQMNPITQISEIFTWGVNKSTLVYLCLDFDNIPDKKVIFQQVKKLKEICELTITDMTGNYLGANNLEQSIQELKKTQLQTQLANNLQQNQADVNQENPNEINQDGSS